MTALIRNKRSDHAESCNINFKNPAQEVDASTAVSGCLGNGKGDGRQHHQRKSKGDTALGKLLGNEKESLKGRHLILDWIKQAEKQSSYTQKSLLHLGRSHSRQAGSALGPEDEDGGIRRLPPPQISGRARLGSSAAFAPRRHGGRQPAADMWHGEREQRWGTPPATGPQSAAGCEPAEIHFFLPLAFVYYNTSLKEAQKCPVGSLSWAISPRCIQPEAETGSVENLSPSGSPTAPEHPCPCLWVERRLQHPAEGSWSTQSIGELFCHQLLFP